MIVQKVYLLLESLAKLSDVINCFAPALTFLIDIHCSLITCLNPDFNYSNTFVLSWAEKATTGPSSFLSVILKVFPWFAAVLDDITQIRNQVRKGFPKIISIY